MKKAIHKYIVILGLLILIVLSSFGVHMSTQIMGLYAVRFSGGIGTQQDPYIIASVQDLLNFGTEVNSGTTSGYYGKYLSLANDIDLSNLSGSDIFAPIGTVDYPFEGNFDGNGHTVKLKINTPDKSDLGLFGTTGTYSKISNLSIDGEIVGGSNVGGLVGHNRGVVSNCFNYATIANQNTDEVERIGGLVGYNEGEVLESGNIGTINIYGTDSAIVGGVVGFNFGRVESSFNAGPTNSQGNLVGGIAGHSETGSTVHNSFNFGQIYGDTAVGGIVGQNKGDVSVVYNTGDINGARDGVGGLVGNNWAQAKVSNAYSASTVVGSRQVGALIGLNSGQIWYSYFDSDKFVGSIANGGAVFECFDLNTLNFTQADVLSNADKALYLQSDIGQGLWSKRVFSDDYAYYPELEFFKDNDNSFFDKVSEQSVRVDRAALSDIDLNLSQTDYMYSGLPNEPQVYLGALLLIRDMDYTVVYVDNMDYGVARADITLINYFVGNVSLEFYINIKPLTVEWSDQQFVYNGQVQHPLATISGNVEGQDIHYHYVYTDSIRAGKQEVQVVLDVNDTNANYQIASNDICTYQIQKATLTLDWNDSFLIYSGQRQFPTATVVGSIDNQVVDLEYIADGVIDVGIYTVTAKLVDNDINSNYYLAALPYEFTIVKRPIEIVLDSEVLVYNGKAQYPKVGLVINVVDRQQLTFIYDEYQDNIDANENDEYIVKVSLADTALNSNYIFEPEYHHYSIVRRALTIDFFDDTLYYNGFAQYPNFFVSSGVVGTDQIEFKISDYSSNILASLPNAYSVTIALADNSTNANYYLQPVTIEYGIQKATLDLDTLTFEDSTYLWDGQEKSILIQDLPIGVSAEYIGNGQKNAGDYVVIAKISVDSNYNQLSNDTIQARLYIVDNRLVAFEEGVIVEIVSGDIRYGTTLGVTYQVYSNKFLASSVILRYMDVALVYNGSSTNFVGSAKVQVRLDDNQIDNKGLKVAYIDLQNNKHYVEYSKLDKSVEFEANDFKSIVIEGKNDTQFVYFIAGLALIVAIQIVILVLVVKSKGKNKKSPDKKHKNKFAI